MAHRWTRGIGDALAADIRGGMRVNDLLRSSSSIRPTGSTHGPLLWEDDFAGSALDTTKWAYGVDNSFLGGRDASFDNSATQCAVANSVLTITAAFTTVNGKAYSSGAIFTATKQAFPPGGSTPYGYYEAKMRIPSVIGTWPAFWMLCYDYFTTTTSFLDDATHPYAIWEVDAMESIDTGSKVISYNNHSRNPTTGTLNSGAPDTDWDSVLDPNGTGAANTLYAPYWHIYGCSISATNVKWYFDGTLVANMAAGATTRASGGALGGAGVASIMPTRSCIILQLAVGGGSVASGGSGVPTSSNFPQVMEVDWVRMYRDP